MGSGTPPAQALIQKLLQLVDLPLDGAQTSKPLEGELLCCPLLAAWRALYVILLAARSCAICCALSTSDRLSCHTGL